MTHKDPFRNPAPLIRRVYSYVAYRIGAGPDAEDVTSEVFERALRYRSSFDHRRGRTVPWLLGIARRCVDDALARRPPATSFFEDAQQASDEDVEGEVVERLAVVGALERLDDRAQDLIALRYGADLSARQIGEILGMKTNAVEVALHRALARLRSEVEETESQTSRAGTEPAPRIVP
jgi:RNA polymerase sigma-70 factor, ECF subfamily